MNQRYRHPGAEQLSLSASPAATPVSLTLGFPPGHTEEGWKRKEVYYGWSLLFQRADERSTKFHCEGMHFKGQFKTNKILSALTTELKGGSSRIILCTYYQNMSFQLERSPKRQKSGIFFYFQVNLKKKKKVKKI